MLEWTRGGFALLYIWEISFFEDRVSVDHSHITTIMPNDTFLSQYHIGSNRIWEDQVSFRQMILRQRYFTATCTLVSAISIKRRYERIKSSWNRYMYLENRHVRIQKPENVWKCQTQIILLIVMYENHFHYNGQINGGQIQFTYNHWACPPEVPQRVLHTQHFNKNISKHSSWYIPKSPVPLLIRLQRLRRKAFAHSFSRSESKLMHQSYFQEEMDHDWNRMWKVLP